jgi:hypothetical protein
MIGAHKALVKDRLNKNSVRNTSPFLIKVKGETLF